MASLSRLANVREGRRLARDERLSWRICGCSGEKAVQSFGELGTLLRLAQNVPFVVVVAMVVAVAILGGRPRQRHHQL